MPKFRKKPVVIEAVQITNDWLLGQKKLAVPDPSFILCNDGILVRTLEGTLQGRIGDWLITGVKGEKYPCKPDIFEATYEEVKDANN